LKILQRTIRRKRGKHCARIRFEDNNGKIHEIMRTADNKTAAKTRKRRNSTGPNPLNFFFQL